MIIEFLPFGNVTVAFLILLVAVLVVCLGYELFRLAVRFMLNLDAENAPKLFESNVIFDSLCNIQSPFKFYMLKLNQLHHCYLYAGPDGKTDYASLLSGFSTREEAEKAISYGKYCTIGISEHRSFLPFSLMAMVIDICIFWGTHHFTSFYITVLSVGIPLAIRKLSGVVWSHDVRITKLEGSKDEQSS